MARSLKTVVLKTPDCEDSTLRPSLLGIDGAQIVADLTPDDDLVRAVNQARPDVLVIIVGRADCQPVLENVAALLTTRRDLTVVLAGPERDPDLLLGAMRSGVREFVHLPTNPEALLEVLQKIIEIQPARRTGSIIAVHGCGGGCGTSSVVCNMAVEIARSGRGSVAVVDLDIHRGQLAAMLDVFPTYTLLDVCRLDGDDLDHARLESALLKHDSGVRLLARPKELLSEDVGVLGRIVPVIHGLSEMFDFVFVDYDLRTDVTDGLLAKSADDLLLICQPVINAVRNASEIIRELDALGVDTDRIRLVLNRVPKRPGSIRVENVEKSLKRSTFWEIPEDYAAVAESLNLGVPLCEYATTSKARCSIRDMALALTRSQAGEMTGAGKSKSLLKRIFKTNVA